MLEAKRYILQLTVFHFKRMSFYFLIIYQPVNFYFRKIRGLLFYGHFRIIESHAI